MNDHETHEALVGGARALDGWANLSRVIDETLDGKRTPENLGVMVVHFFGAPEYRPGNDPTMLARRLRSMADDPDA